jgi:glycosyltransferase involved in cell wall biosynthesis
MPKILMIAFHFPPYQGGSGVHRTLKFSRYLPEFGWDPIVLTATPRAYPSTGEDQLADIPQQVLVKRAFAVDAARHLSVHGNYPKFLAMPDRWSSWWFAGVAAGLRLIRKHRPRCIWSTYPIATAHLIGLTLHKITGLAWVVYFRDTMTEQNYPAYPTTWEVYRWIEQRAVAACSLAVFTAPGALTMYAQRYPRVPDNRWKIIPNGYDEEDFAGIDILPRTAPVSRRPLTLLHSGVLYASERNPDAFFAALRRLRQANLISPCDLRIILRGCGDEDRYRRKLSDFGIDDIVFIEKTIPYREALREMMTSDGLLIFQAANCNWQIPAKIFEYFRVGKPILALTDAAGDTAALLRRVNIESILPLDSSEQIEVGLMRFIQAVRCGTSTIAQHEDIVCYSRQSGTKDLAETLDYLAQDEPVNGRTDSK